MAYNAKAQKKYRDKSIQLAVNYRPGTDVQDGKRIKADLDSKGFVLPDTARTKQPDNTEDI